MMKILLCLFLSLFALTATAEEDSGMYGIVSASGLAESTDNNIGGALGFGIQFSDKLSAEASLNYLGDYSRRVAVYNQVLNAPPNYLALDRYDEHEDLTAASLEVKWEPFPKDVANLYFTGGLTPAHGAPVFGFGVRHKHLRVFYKRFYDIELFDADVTIDSIGIGWEIR